MEVLFRVNFDSLKNETQTKLTNKLNFEKKIICFESVDNKVFALAY